MPPPHPARHPARMVQPADTEAFSKCAVRACQAKQKGRQTFNIPRRRRRLGTCRGSRQQDGAYKTTRYLHRQTKIRENGLVVCI